MTESRDASGLTRPPSGSQRRNRRARELTLHAGLLGCAVWLVVFADVLSPGPLGRFSKAHKGNDFVQFYVMASLARRGSYETLANEREFREAQSHYVIAGDRLSYPPVYGPQIAVAVLPLAWFEYEHAYALFSVVTLALIALAVRLCWRRCEPLRNWGITVAVVTAAFPPLGYLVLNGQFSAVGIVALALMVEGLARRSRLLTGAALGILGYKFSLLFPALAVCTLAGEWAIAAAALTAAALQLICVTPIVGVDVVISFARNTLAVAQNPDLLARSRFLMGSLRTFWGGVLPGVGGQIAYAVTALVCILAAAAAWRRTRDPLQKVAVLSIAIALTAPHFYLYDLVIVAPAFLASATLLLDRQASLLRWSTYLSFVCLLAVPAAVVTGIQFVTILLAVWFVAFVRELARESASGSSGPPPESVPAR